ncbi:MAG: PrsW family glutamic-type intramembrane protease [Candidatus Taylorbacteria bacterium]
MAIANTIAYSLIGGIIPALIWLWFWLKEDHHPEPKRLIIYAFLAGMLMVPLVIPFQQYVQATIFPGDISSPSLFHGPTVFTPFVPLLTRLFPMQVWLIILWAGLEELFKFIAAYFVVLRRKDDNEPVDKIIYLITVALGFSALENALFIFNPLFDGNYSLSFITSNLRFVGATLLHTICSASIGVALGLAFYKSRLSKFLHLLGGFAVALALHTSFNLFIINSKDEINFAVFYFVWLSIIILLLFFEKIKSVININAAHSEKASSQ